MGAVLALLLFVGGGLAWATTRSGPPSTCRDWRFVRASFSPSGGYAFGVSGTSTRDVWSVGTTHDSSHPLIAHWDGRRWSLTLQPGIDGALNAIVAISPVDAWAVGLRYDAPQTLVEHWDGTAWRVVSSPSPGSQFNTLHAVTATSSTDVWAAGYYQNPGSLDPLLAHWDGKNWRVVPLGPGASPGIPNGVSATSATDAWAVGYKDAEIGFNTSPVAYHWNGTDWLEVSVDLPPDGLNAFESVSAVTANDVWAVGSTSNGSLIEHWDGSAWHIVTGAPEVTNLRGVSAISETDVWASGNGADEAATEHWDGSSWTAVAIAAPGTGSALYAIDAISATDVWTTGAYTPPTGVAQPLFEHSRGVCP
jgi:hypothetical protein